MFRMTVRVPPADILAAYAALSQAALWDLHASPMQEAAAVAEEATARAAAASLNAAHAARCAARAHGMRAAGLVSADTAAHYAAVHAARARHAGIVEWIEMRMSARQAAELIEWASARSAWDGTPNATRLALARLCEFTGAAMVVALERHTPR